MGAAREGTRELTRYADDMVIVCKTKTDADQAYKLLRAIMERLELTLHPEKTRVVGLWTGEQGFDFLGMHHRKTKAETSQGRVYYTTQQWLTTKAEKHIREVIKERLAPSSARGQSLEDHVAGDVLTNASEQVVRQEAQVQKMAQCEQDRRTPCTTERLGIVLVTLYAHG
jgi:hypothetical protein